MTDLIRPVPGQSLLDSDGAGTASTTIMTAYADLIESNEDSLTARTSPHLVTTEPYSDTAALTLSDGSSLTGWHATNNDTADSVPGPALVTIVGRNAVQAYLKAPSNNFTPALYVNLTEIGYPSGLTVSPGHTIIADFLVSTTAGFNPFTGAFLQFGLTLASGVDMSGTLESIEYDSIEILGHVRNRWYTAAISVGALTTIRSIGIKKVGSGGSSGARARYNLTNIRQVVKTPLDQAYGSQTAVTAVVPASYPSTATQYPFSPSATKSLVDLRPDKAWVSGMGGVHNIREWGLDETGTMDMAHELQAAIDSLSSGDVLTFPPGAAIRCDAGIRINNPNLTIDGCGAALIQAFPEDIYDGSLKIAQNENPRIQIQETADYTTIRNLRVFGASITPQLGSVFTTATGGAVSGTTMQLAALNAATTFFNYPGRDWTGVTRQDFVLYDTSHVPNDCIITCTDEDGVVLTTQTVPVLGTAGSPTIVTVNTTPRNLYSGHTVSVKKATGTANIITLVQMRTFNNCLTSFVGHIDPADITSPTFEFAHGIMVANATNVLLENVTLEAVQGDGIWLNNSLPTTGNNGVTVRNLLIRGNGRQGLAICGGSHHRFENCVLMFSARHTVDIEPEFPLTSAVDGVDIRNMICWKPGLTDPFQTSSSLAWARARHFSIDGLKIYVDSSGGFNCGLRDSTVRNLEVYATANATNANCSIDGLNVTLDGARIDGRLQVGVLAAATSTDTSSVVWTAKNVQVKNVLLTKQVIGGPYLITEQIGAHLENIRIADDIPIDQTYAVLGFQILADTTYTGLDLPAHRALFPASYPGVAIGQPWFPAGLDMKGRGLNRVAYLSGGTIKGNNLGRFQQAVTAGSTTLTCAFPVKTYPNVFTITMSSSTGGTLTPSTTYHYRFAARNRYGGPVVATSNQTIAMSGSGTAVTMTIDGMYDVPTGVQIDGITIYRGLASGNYTHRYDIVPSSDIYSMGGQGQNTNKRMPLKDLGTTISPTGNYYALGYTFPVAVTVGAFTPVDETGYEPDTNYAVFVEPSWQTTWKVSARRRDGFDLEFGTAAPTGTQTISYMIARF